MSPAAVPAELRRLVRERAQRQCEYCLTPEIVTLIPHEADHIIAQKHGGPTEQGNLALACPLCNQHKRTDLASLDPETGSLTPLYNPRQDRWQEHFALQGATIVGLSPVGRTTVRLLQLNAPARLTERELYIRLGDLRLPE